MSIRSLSPRFPTYSATLFALSIWLHVGWVHAYQYEHEILPGDTVKSLSRHYRLPPTSILRQNKLKADKLKAGRTLAIQTPHAVPVQHKFLYKVKKGDTVAEIVKHFDMPQDLFKRLNSKLTSRPLRVGESLWVVTQQMPRKKSAAPATIIDPQQSVATNSVVTGKETTVIEEDSEEEGGESEEAEISPTRRRYHQLQEGPGFKLKRQQRAFGTLLTVSRIRDVMAEFNKKYADADPVMVWDLSQDGGGRLEPHKSHRTGRDVDIAYVLKRAGIKTTLGTIDIEKSWYLIKSFIDTGVVEYVFVDHQIQRKFHQFARKVLGMKPMELYKYLQYPRKSKTRSGFIRHEKGHFNHFHVRFKEPDPQNENEPIS